MDFAGPFGPVSNKVNKYVMVYVDNFSRYTYLVSCNSNSAAAALRALREHIFPHTGPPDTLIIDGAGAFVSDKFKEELEALNVEIDMIAPDNHRANGLAERQVRLLNDIMRHLSEANKARWAAYLRDIQYSIGTTPSADTGISPYEMWTGYPLEERRPARPQLAR
jgi:transposase InsO family protein